MAEEAAAQEFANEEVPLSKAAGYVIWVCEGEHAPGAMQPGTFYELLIRAALHADGDNLTRLMAGFPRVATVVHMYKNHAVGRDALLVWAEERLAQEAGQ